MAESHLRNDWLVELKKISVDEFEKIDLKIKNRIKGLNPGKIHDLVEFVNHIKNR